MRYSTITLSIDCILVTRIVRSFSPFNNQRFNHHRNFPLQPQNSSTLHTRNSHLLHHLRRYDPFYTICTHSMSASNQQTDSPIDDPNTDIQQQTPPNRTLLKYINDSTKWTVSFAAFSTLLYRRDILSAWCIFGSIVAAVICRLLKFAINESRPPSARKKDPGMPSAHANSLSFLSSFVSCSAAAVLSSEPSFFRIALVYGVPCIGVFLAWLRVSLGYHTAAQVVAGWTLGSTLAVVWCSIGLQRALPIIEQSLELQYFLWGLTGTAVAFFVFKNMKRWLDELHHDNEKKL